jgi:hypothetical protein
VTLARTSTRTGDRTIARLYLLWVVLTLGIPFAIGYGTAARRRDRRRSSRRRIFLYQHATARELDLPPVREQGLPRRDESRNNWLVAFMVFGEGWHNNHAFPSSARRPGLVAVRRVWWIIRSLELGLVWDVSCAVQQMQRRAVTLSAAASLAF